MANGGLRKVHDGVGKELQAIVKRGRSVSSYLTRVIWPAYQQAQIDRWQSENSTQGSRWKPLEKNYAKSKLTKFAAYPGTGHAMMVATSKLSEGAQGRDSAFFGRTIEDDKIEVAINTSAIPYAIYAAEQRAYMAFSDIQMKEWTDGVAQYIMRGKE